MSDATLRQLEYFIAAVEEGSVTAAAQRLHLSQSALSMALGELERALGVQVLVRHRRGVRPTRIGEQVLVDARRLLVDLEDLQSKVDAHSSDLAAIMVTALAIFLMNLLIDIAYAVLDPRIRT